MDLTSNAVEKLEGEDDFKSALQQAQPDDIVNLAERYIVLVDASFGIDLEDPPDPLEYYNDIKKISEEAKLKLENIDGLEIISAIHGNILVKGTAQALVNALEIDEVRSIRPHIV